MCHSNSGYFFSHLPPIFVGGIYKNLPKIVLNLFSRLT